MNRALSWRQVVGIPLNVVLFLLLMRGLDDEHVPVQFRAQREVLTSIRQQQGARQSLLARGAAQANAVRVAFA
jgi:hypothetical protein